MFRKRILWVGLILLLLIGSLGSIARAYADQGDSSDGRIVAQTQDSDGDGLTDDVDICPQLYSPPTEFNTTGCPDSDEDGIHDPFDSCPQQYAPRTEDGCPLATEPATDVDTDKDGLPDSVDKCPQQAGPRENSGCPVATVTPIPVSDRDGDTVPDDQDVCPDEKGYPEWGGCADVDNDGLTTQYDGCPTENGPRENNGCPVEEQAPPTGDIDRDGLPDNQDSCPRQFGPVDNDGCPVEEQPSDRDQDGLPDDQDECPDEFGTAENFGCPEQTDVEIAPPQIDLSVALGNCPDLIIDAMKLPIFVQLDLANGGMVDPCAYAQELLGSLVFGDDKPGLSPENMNAILENCPEVLPALLAMMDTLYPINPNAWSILDSVMTPDNACQLATSIAQQVMPPEFAAALGGSSGTPVPHAQIVLTSSHAAPTLLPASAAVIDANIALCLPGITPARAALIRNRMLAAAVQDTDLVPPCPLITIFSLVGDLTSAQQALVNLLVTSCGFTYANALVGVMSSVVTLHTDVVAVLNLGAAAICVDPLGVMAAHLLNPLTDPNIPTALAGCIGLSVLFQNYASELTLYTIWVILNDPVPCALAANFIATGSLGVGPFPGPPACFNVPANTVTPAPGTVITAATAWSHKMAVLGRPVATVCTPIVLPPPDTDGDGKPDTVDACPTQFALSADGCPAPPPNLPPVVTPIANVSLNVGASINVAVVANDPEAAPIGVGAVSSDPTKATVSAAGAVLTINGIAAGTSTITVNVTDGVNVVNVAFTATVNPAPPAPNAPPTINPIGAQTVAVGASVAVTVVASDPEAAPVTLTAAPADSSIATISFAGTTLTITGKKAGSTPITVIASDGSLTASTVFTVTVTGGGSKKITKQQIQQAAVANGTPPEELAFGLLTLPSDENIEDISAAFQASTGEAQPVKIYILLNGELTPLFADTPESHYFPALDPTGKLLIFITVPQTGDTVLRAYNIDQEASLPLFTAGNGLTIGLYPPTWAPDGKQILLTLLDANGVPGVYAISMADPLHIPAPTLLVANATTGNFAPNGRYMAYEQVGPDGASTIFVAVTNKPGVVHPVTQQPAGSSCHSPVFGTDSISLYFICELNGAQTLYRYNVQGLEPLQLGVQTIENPAPGPGDGFIAFDDGATIYYGFEDGSKVVPMVRLENMSATNIRWKTLTDLQ